MQAEKKQQTAQDGSGWALSASWAICLPSEPLFSPWESDPAECKALLPSHQAMESAQPTQTNPT